MIIVLQHLSEEIKAIKTRSERGEEMQLSVDKILQYGVSDDDFCGIYGKNTPPVYLLSHLEHVQNVIYH